MYIHCGKRWVSFLNPTYALELFTKVDVHSLCHITGGGLPENLPRVLPENCRAVIDGSSWQRPAVFDWLQQQGNIARSEMYRTFNCGIGMVVVVAAEQAQLTIDTLRTTGEEVAVIGTIEAHDGGEQMVLQARAPILAGDTPESLAARVLEQEHQIYPEAIRQFVLTQQRV